MRGTFFVLPFLLSKSRFSSEKRRGKKDSSNLLGDGWVVNF